MTFNQRHEETLRGRRAGHDSLNVLFAKIQILVRDGHAQQVQQGCMLVVVIPIEGLLQAVSSFLVGERFFCQGKDSVPSILSMADGIIRVSHVTYFQGNIENGTAKNLVSDYCMNIVCSSLYPATPTLTLPCPGWTNI